MTGAGEGGPWRYKLLPPGAFGTPPFAVPDESHREAEYVVDWLQRQLDWCHGVRVRWFDALGPADREGDPGTFAYDHPLWGCVDPHDPLAVRLNLALCARPTAQLIRITVHEGLHCQQLSMGLERRLSHEELERLADDLVGLLCQGLPA